jgi:N-acetyl-alpha-D-muramate 1-phosphate uridylyltransferase
MNTLMIFAAGFGTRMRHLTEDMPKSLVKINGKPILYYTLEAALRHGFDHIIINSHYKADQIKAAVDAFIDSHPNSPRITILYEDPILETGGGVKNALSLIDSDHITTINSDIIIHSERDFFSKLEESWDPKIMDFLILIHQTNKALGYTGKGDFEMDQAGKLTLRPAKLDHYQYMHAGAQIFKTSLVANHPKAIFSLNEFYQGDYNLYGALNDGLWCHLSCPEDLPIIEKALK